MNHFHQAEFMDLTAEGRSMCIPKSCATRSSEHSHINPGKYVDSHIPGMETIVVTVSGYDSLTRTKLIKLIVHVGALNTGSLSNCNTHLVCWKFEGRKYELAKKLRKKIVSHRWFEDCVKAGVLLPEEPYIDKSGSEEAPMCWDDSKVDLPHGSPLRKIYCSINLAESVVSQPEGGSGWDTSLTRQHGLSTSNGRFSNLNHSDAGWSLSTSSKRAVSSKTYLPSSGIDRAVSSDAAHLPRAQTPDEYLHKALNFSDDGSQQLEGPRATPLPLELRMGKAVRFCAPILSPLMDPLNGTRHRGERAYESRRDSDEVGQHERPYCFPHFEHYRSSGQEDLKADYSQIRLRRRKEVEVPSGSLSEKYRRLMNEPRASTSAKLACKDDRTGSRSRAFSGKYVGRQSCQQSAWNTVSVGVEVENQSESYVVAEKDNPNSLVEKAVLSASPSKDIACVICHTETKPTTEGLLECGHRYCYPCIQKWADEAISKQSTCPLCKASFEFITIRELERSVDEGLCTQVLEERVVLVGKQIRQGQKINLTLPRTEGICITCESKDTPEFLMTCGRCCQRSCHTFCLDPPVSPGTSWFCSRCSPIASRYTPRDNFM